MPLRERRIGVDLWELLAEVSATDAKYASTIAETEMPRCFA